MTDAFNPGDYWETRHAELQGDHRNVGNRGLTSEQNLSLIASKAALVCHRLGALGLKAGASVLDAGCGSGTFTSMLAPIGFQLFGCDISPTAIDAAGELGIGEFKFPALQRSASTEHLTRCFVSMFFSTWSTTPNGKHPSPGSITRQGLADISSWLSIFRSRARSRRPIAVGVRSMTTREP